MKYLILNGLKEDGSFDLKINKFPKASLYINIISFKMILPNSLGI
jgi:hypothetical protein